MMKRIKAIIFLYCLAVGITTQAWLSPMFEAGEIESVSFNSLSDDAAITTHLTKTRAGILVYSDIYYPQTYYTDAQVNALIRSMAVKSRRVRRPRHRV